MVRSGSYKGLALGPYQGRVEGRIKDWEAARFAARLLAKDFTLWSPRPLPELADRLGWLELPRTMKGQLRDLSAFAEEIRAEGFAHVVLLGMGGSSLAPEVFQRTFGNREGYPELMVLDSTHPASVLEAERRLELARAFFLVSSKSGTTTETLSLFRYFWQRLKQIDERPGRRFAAITDPATPLERLAKERGFRRTFQAPPDVGGRYSALTVFGLVPAALIGVDVQAILERAERLSALASGSDNPSLALGAALGELAMAGRDKVTFFASRSLAALPVWIEQLIAESTGKDGKGIVPAVDEPMGPSEVYGTDRFFVCFHVSGDGRAEWEGRIGALEAAGHPVARIDLSDRSELGGEFFRWEVAVAAAGAILAIHPFDQPDVELAKQLARRAMEKKGGGLEEGKREGVVGAEKREELAGALRAWLGQAAPGDYVGLQAYLPPTREITALSQEIRAKLRDRLRLATTLGFGPRFLHSTGQLHKGGPNTGLFLQLVDDPVEDVAVPESDYTFRALIRAQALGDFEALRQRGRRLLRVELGKDAVGGLESLNEALGG